jgi:hypothetical protein
LFDFGKRCEPLFPRGGFELLHSNEFLFQTLFVYLAVLNQQVGLAFNQLVELPVVVEEANDQVVGDEQGSGADQPAEYAVVFPDDGVLHGIGQSEQNDQVERIQLDEFALPGEPKTDYQEAVNDNRPKDFFQQGKSHDEHVFQDIVHCRCASSKY